MNYFKSLKLSIPLFIVIGVLATFAQPDTTAPVVTFLLPGNDSYFSCDSGCIVLKITDESPIDLLSSFLTAWIRGVPYVLPESTSSSMDSIYYFPLPTSLFDGDSVYLSYAPICDMIHNCRDTMFIFYADLTPPQISLIAPPEGVLAAPSFTFRALVEDTLSGISQDSSQISVSVYGTDNWYILLYFTSPYIAFPDDTLSIDMSALGVFSGGDTISICVSAVDNAVGCGANRTDSCYIYTLPLTEPTITLVYPFNSAIVGNDCADSLVFRIDDVDSIVSITVIADGDTFHLGDPEIFFDGTFVHLNTSGIFEDGAYSTIIISCTDIYNTASEDTFHIWTDFSAPYVFDISPPESSLIVDTVETISVWLTDDFSGVEPSSVTLTVDSAPVSFDYDSTNGEMSFEYIFYGYSDTSDSVYLMICITADDRPDICNNDLDTCFQYMLYINTTLPVVTPPAEIITGCSDQNIIIAAQSTFGIDSAEVTLELRSTVHGLLDFMNLTDSTFNMMTYSHFPSGVDDSLFFTPIAPLYWNDSDTILCIFDYSFIGSGNENRSWLFYTDFSPPYFSAIYPTDGSIVMVTPDTLLFTLGDLVSGLWEPEFYCTLYVNTVPTSVPFGALLRVGYDSFKLPLNNIGILLNGCDSVVLAIHIPDRVSTDYCGPNILNAEWNFSLDCGAPYAELISPTIDAMLSCSLQTISFFIAADANLDSNSIVLIVDGDTIFYGDMRLVFTAPGTLAFIPTIPWSNGDTVSGELTSLSDYVGNTSSAVPFQFIIDTSPPEIVPIYPVAGALITDSLARIRILIIDETVGLADYGFSADFGSAFTSVAGDTFIFDPTTAGIILGPEDTVCITVWASDSASGCGQNSDTLNYCFAVDAVGPRVTYVDSIIGGFTSCDDRAIRFQFYDFLGLNEYFVRLYSSHDSDTLDISSPEIYTDDSTIIYTPATAYSNGENVRIEVLSAPDIAGNDMVQESLAVEFTVDLSPPYIDSILPAPGDTLGTTVPNVSFVVLDDISGVYWENCSLRVFRNTSWDTLLLFGSSGFSLFGDTLFLSFRDAGIILEGSDSITVCLSVFDAIFDTLSGCGAHWIDSCIYFYIDASPPTVAPVRPGDGAITSCIDQAIAFTITDSEGVDWDTLVFVVGAETLNLGSIGVSHTPMSDSVVYYTGAPLYDDTVNVWVIYARDTLGNELETPVHWVFYIDTIPPTMISQYPPADGFIGETSPIITATFIDEITAMVLSDSFSIDGVWNSSSSYFIIDSFGYAITDSLADGTHTICIEVHDQPDFCDPNSTIYCWDFWIDTAPPSLDISPDTLLTVACDTFVFDFTASDMDSVILVDVWSNSTFRDTAWSLDSTTIEGDVIVDAPAEDDTVLVVITVSDSLGNAAVDSAYIFFDRTAPFISFLSPADGETVSVRNPWIIVTAEDTLSGVNPADAYISVPGAIFYYDTGDILWNGDEFAIDLSSLGYLLPERTWSTIIVGGIADSVDSIVGCGPNIADEETIRIFVADDDTLPPEFSPPDIEWGWCTGQVQPQWTIFDSSGVDSAYAIIAYDSILTDGEIVPMTFLGSDIWTLDTAITLDSDTIWIMICAVDADSESGAGDDTTWGCSQVFYITCEKPFLTLLNDTIDFGTICIDRTVIDSFALENPTGVDIDFSLQLTNDTDFSLGDSSFTISAGETMWVVVNFAPHSEEDYSETTMVVIDELPTYYVILLGSGELCPIGFSAKPLTITPNEDGHYDGTIFTFSLPGDNKVEIFSKTFFKVKTICTNSVHAIWRGKDNNEKDCPGGAYLFVAYENGVVVGKGVIVIAR